MQMMRRKADMTNEIQSRGTGEDVYSSPAAASSSLFSALSIEVGQ